MASRELFRFAGLLVSALLLFSCSSSHRATFRVIANYETASATAVSDDGSTVLVYFRESPRSGQSLLRWNEGSTTMITTQSDLGPAMSGDGSVVAGAGTGHRVFRRQNGELTELGFVTHTSIEISADGSTIVGLGEAGAFQYRDDVLTYLPVPDGNIYSDAMGVNADGTVIVGQVNWTSRTEAYRWERGVMQGLGDLDGGAFASVARDVTPDGTVVVGLATSAAGAEAFRWQDGVMTGLGQLAGQPTGAIAVSADGTTIVGTFGSERVGAMVWDPVHGVRDLKQVLVQDFRLDLSSFELTWASAISNDGRTIVGGGRVLGASRRRDYPEREIAWVVQLSEPLGRSR